MTPEAVVALGFVLILLGIPMIRKWLPREGFDWLMLPGLAISDEAWYESHRRSGWDFVLAGAGVIVLALWTAWASGGEGVTPGVRDFLGVSVLAALVIAGVRSVIVTFRLARERDTVR